MNLLRVNRKRHCAICGKSDWCLLHPEGKFVLCMRVSSDRPATGGRGWIHFAEENNATRQRVAASIASPAKPLASVRSSDEHLNDVYTALFDELQLTDHHAQSLKIRGLTDTLLHVHGYRSMPSPSIARQIAKVLAGKYDLDSVPGFYLDKDEWQFRTYNARGFLIPIRNYKHQIVGLTLRTDGDQQWKIDGKSVQLPKYLLISSEGKIKGASSGTPPHFALLGGNFKRSAVTELIVTEGALKANISAYFLSTPVIGLVGVGCFDETFPLLLKEAFPNLEKVKIAFDMDARTNLAVRQQRERLADLLEASFVVRIITWSEKYKGLDDYCLYQSNKGRGTGA